jgi:hypothetical protein
VIALLVVGVLGLVPVLLRLRRLAGGSAPVTRVVLRESVGARRPRYERPGVRLPRAIPLAMAELDGDVRAERDCG